ncbi:MAG: hypothetical protein H7318_16710 [Oligoflexus sp.]|nr:hypothetical protein [Oligoflexus sp.]
MSVQSFAEASDRSLHPTDAKSDKNYFAGIPQEAPLDIKSRAHEEQDDENENEIEYAAPEEPQIHESETVSHAPHGKSQARAAGSSRSKAPKLKTKASHEKAHDRTAKSGNEKTKAPVELSSLKQKALDLVHKGSDEIAHRYSHVYDDMKDVSKKVSDRMKGKPYQIAMGAAGVVGLGVVLAKKYNQNRRVKSPGSPASDSLHS